MFINLLKIIREYVYDKPKTKKAISVILILNQKNEQSDFAWDKLL